MRIYLSRVPGPLVRNQYLVDDGATLEHVAEKYGGAPAPTRGCWILTVTRGGSLLTAIEGWRPRGKTGVILQDEDYVCLIEPVHHD